MTAPAYLPAVHRLSCAVDRQGRAVTTAEWCDYEEEIRSARYDIAARGGDPDAEHEAAIDRASRISPNLY